MKRFVRERMAVLGVAIAMSTAGCASSRALTCPGEITSTWKELESAHFRLVTNRRLDDARIALADFEETYDVFTGVVLSGEIIDPVPIRVVLFDQENEYKAFGPRGAGAHFTPSLPLDVEPIPTLVMWGDLMAEARMTFQHELTHHIFRNALGPVPAWLSEGLADYYATVRVDGGEVYIGESNPRYEFYLNPNWAEVDTGPYLRYRIPVGDIPKANELVAMDRQAFYESGNKELDANGGVPIEEWKRRTSRYAGSWALVHMLTHQPEYGERWAQLLSGLVAGKGYAGAMDEAFGPVMDSIPVAFHEYLITHHRTAVKTKFTPKTRVCPKDERPASESRVKTLYAQLRPFRGRVSADDVDAKTAMQADLDSAVQLDSQFAPVLYRGMYYLQIGDVDAAARDLETAYKKAPKDGNVLIGVARLCLHRAEEGLPALPFCETNQTAVRETVVKSAKTPYTHLVAAALLDGANQKDDALEHAKRAVKLDPGCAPCLEALGEMLHERGMVREAIVFEERALAALPETARGDELVKRIQQYRKELVEAAKARKKESEP
jgi:tetratricopeptide (TPR) repeat protein